MLKDPIFIPSQDWVFGHFWMLALPAWLFNDFEFAPRLVSLIPGILFPIPLFYLGKRLFGEAAAIIGCLLYAFSPPLLLLSGSTLTAIPFSFLLITGILCMIKYEESRQVQDLLWSALCLMLANSLRLEAWIYSFAIGLYLIFREKKITKNILIYAIITSAPILTFMWDNFTTMGHPFYALIFSDYVVRKSIEGEPLDIMYIIPELRRAFAAFSGPGLLLSAAGMIIALKRKIHIFTLGLFIATYFTLTYKIINKTLIPHFRYFTAHAIFGCLLSGYFIAYCLNAIKHLKINKAILTCAFTVYILSSIKQIICHSAKSRAFPH